MDMANIMRQALEMQKTLKRLEKELDHQIWETVSGPVTLKVNGKFEVVELAVDPAFLSPADPKKLAERLKTGFNEAVRKVRKERESRIKAAIPIPPGIPGIGPLFT